MWCINQDRFTGTQKYKQMNKSNNYIKYISIVVFGLVIFCAISVPILLGIVYFFFQMLFLTLKILVVLFALVIVVVLIGLLGVIKKKPIYILTSLSSLKILPRSL